MVWIFDFFGLGGLFFEKNWWTVWCVCVDLDCIV